MADDPDLSKFGPYWEPPPEEEPMPQVIAEGPPPSGDRRQTIEGELARRADPNWPHIGDARYSKAPPPQVLKLPMP